MITCRILPYNEAVAFVSKSDEYSVSVGKSAVVLKKNNVADEKGYLDLCVQSVSQEQTDLAINSEKINDFIEENLQVLNDYFTSRNIDIDLEFYLVVGSGIESYGMPYTRMNGIVYTSANRICSTYLFFHEFFHILSRSQPKIREYVYPVFGFKKSDKELINVQDCPILVNPDAVQYNFYTKVKVGEDEVLAIPFINTSTFSERFVLAKLNEDLSFNSLLGIPDTDYGKNLNTGYIAHPEEICADNFYYLFCDTRDELNFKFESRLLKFFKYNK